MGSTGSIVSGINNVLTKLGHECYTMYNVGPKPDKHHLKTYGFLGGKLVRLLRRVFGKIPFYGYLSTKLSLKKVKKINPDIIHIHNIHQHAVNYRALFKFLVKYDFKVIVTLHDCWFFTGGCYHYTLNGCDKWKNNSCVGCKTNKYDIDCYTCLTSVEYSAKKKFFDGLKEFRIVAVSDWLKSEAEKSPFFKGMDVMSIHNGVDTSVFTKKTNSNIKNDFNNKKIILGVASYWGESKGLSMFYQLAEILPEDYHIILIGRSYDQKKYKNITFVENTGTRTRLAEYYSAADVFLSLSKEETFGLVTAEAMACGTSVITYNSTACSEIVEDGCGTVIEPGCSVDDIFYAVKTTIEKYGSHNNRCIEVVREKYDEQIMINKYIDLYCSVMGKV